MKKSFLYPAAIFLMLQTIALVGCSLLYARGLVQNPMFGYLFGALTTSLNCIVFYKMKTDLVLEAIAEKEWAKKALNPYFPEMLSQMLPSESEYPLPGPGELVSPKQKNQEKKDWKMPQPKRIRDH